MFQLTITSVDTVLFHGDAFSVTCPGAEGELTVLAHHAPLITTIQKGVLLVRETKDAPPQEFPIEKGFLEVSADEVVLLV